MATNKSTSAKQDKKLDMFNKLANKTGVIKSRNKMKEITDRDFEKNSSSIIKRFSNMVSFTPDKLNVPSDVLDVGLSERGMASSLVYGDDIQSDKSFKKMRRIQSSGPNAGRGLFDIMTGQNKSLANMYSKNAKLMTKMHSESMSATLKMVNLQNTHMQSMSDSLKQIAQIKSTVTLEYYKNNLDTQNNILKELQDINKNIKIGFNINERGRIVENTRKDSRIKELFNSGDIKGNGAKLLKSLVKEYADSKTSGGASMVSSILPMIGSLYDMGGTPAVASMLLKGGLSAGTKKIGSTLLGGRRSKQLGNLINDPGQYFEIMMNNWGLMNQGTLKGFLGNALGSGKKTLSQVDLTKYLAKDKDGRASFDGSAHTSLTKVIPTLLGKIQSSVSGLPEMHYNYETKRFETLKEGNRLLKSGMSVEFNKQTKEIEKRLYGYTYARGDKQTKVSGIFEILSKEKLLNTKNGDMVLKLIETRGKQLSDGFVKLISYFAQSHEDAGEMLDQANFSVEFLASILYNNKGRMTQQMYDGAYAFKTFIETIRSLDDDTAREAWDRLKSQADESRQDMSRLIEQSLKEAEGSTAGFASYTYGLKSDQGSRFRSRTIDERHSEFNGKKDSNVYSMMSDHIVDLSGVATPEELKQRIKDEYNKMVSPLFIGDINTIGKKLRDKAKILNKERHPFSPMLNKLVDSFSKNGDILGENVDYAELAGVSTWDDLSNKMGPTYNKYAGNHVGQAKDIAKWHLQNNPKLRGVTGIAGLAAYGGLVKMMAEKSGMSGPLGSTMIGTFAAASLGMSGKLTRMMDLMGDEGKEKMKRADGSESNVTKREAMTEAMYREFLPKAWGMNQGMKLGGWIRNNVRFGPILGPVVGLASGMILSKTSGWVVKAASAIGKMGSGILNWAGKKITGNSDVNWGDSVRDMMREKLGLPPINSDTFKMKDILKSDKSKKDNLINTISGRRDVDITKYTDYLNDLKKKDVSAWYREIRRTSGHDNTLRTQNIEMKDYSSISDNLDNEYYGTDDFENKYTSGSIIPDRILNVKVIGGHLDAIGAIGALDNETYKERVKELNRGVISDAGNASPEMKSKLKSIFTRTDTFAKSNHVIKEQEKRQNIQESIEDANRDALEALANNKGENEGGETKKKGLLSGILGKLGAGGGLLGFLPMIAKFVGVGLLGIIGANIIGEGPKFLKNTLDSTKKFVDGSYGTDGKSWTSFGIDVFRGVGSIFDKVGKKFIKKDNILGKLGGTAIDIARKGDNALGKAAGWGVKKLGALGGKELGETAIKFVGEAGEKGLGLAVGSVAKTSVGRVANVAVDKSRSLLIKGIDAFKLVFNKVPLLKKFASKADVILTGAKKVFQDLLEKMGGKILKEGAEAASKRGVISGLKNVLTVGGITAILNIGFIAFDFTQGFEKAAKFFSITKDDNPTFIQKLASGLVYGILSALESIPGIMWFALGVSIWDDAMKYLAMEMYKVLDGTLDEIGMGDNAEEELDMKILNDSGYDKNIASQYNKSEVRNSYKSAKTNANQQILEPSNDTGGIALNGYGGAGEGSSGISGKNVGGIRPIFYEQDKFPSYKLGSVDMQKDGCSLAVMKMISEYKGLNIPDIILISRMKRHALPNHTVSIAYFTEFGGRITNNKQDVTNAIKSKGAALSLLIRNGKTNHFVALIHRDNSTAWLGDPLKSDWEIININDGRLSSKIIGAAIFSSNTIITNLNLPKSGGAGDNTRRIGGFGSSYKKNTFTGIVGSSIIDKIKREAGKPTLPGYYNKFMEQFKNQENNILQPGGGDVGSGGTYIGSNAFEKILSVIAKGEFGVSNPKDPKVLGRASPDTGGSFSFGVPGMNTRSGSMRAFMSGWGQQLGLSGDPTSKAFRDQFKRIAEQNPNAMFSAQAAYLQNKYFKKYMKNGSIKQGLEPHIGPLAGDLGIQSYLMDMTIQKGNVNKYLRAIKGLTPDQAYQKMRSIEMNSMGTEFRSALSDRSSSSRGLQRRIDLRGQAYNSLKGQGGAGGDTRKSNFGWGGKVLKTAASDNYRDYNDNGADKLRLPQSAIVDSFIRQVTLQGKDVQGFFGDQSKDKNVLCGLASALMLQRMRFFNRFFNNGAKNGRPYISDLITFGKKYKGTMDPKKGIHYTYFTAMGGKILINKATTQQMMDRYKDLSNVSKDITVSSFFNDKKYRIDKGDILALLCGQHWMLIARDSDEGGYWILNPTDNAPKKYENSIANLFTWTGTTKVDMAILFNKNYGGYDLISMIDSTVKKEVAGGTTTTSQASPSTGNTGSDGGSSSDGGSTGGSTTTPSRGTSTKFGGWFRGDGSQVMFDFSNSGVSSTTDSGTGFNTSGAATGGTGAAVPGYEDSGVSVINAIEVPSNSRPYKAAMKAVANAKLKSLGYCARYVRIALQYANYTFEPQGSAYMYHTNGILTKAGFSRINTASTPQIGDIMVFDKTDKRIHGHIAIYCGKLSNVGTGWVSDFKQASHLPWSDYGKIYLYRDNQYLGKNSASDKAKSTPTKVKTSGGKEQGASPVSEEKKALKRAQSDYEKANMKQFVASKGERSASAWLRQDMASKVAKKNYQAQRNDTMNKRVLGILDVGYTNNDRNTSKALSTAAGYLQDSGKGGSTGTIMSLLGRLIDVTVENKNATNEMVKETRVQTNEVKKNVTATKEVAKITEKKKENTSQNNVTINQNKAAEEIELFKYIMYDEQEMFKGLTN